MRSPNPTPDPVPIGRPHRASLLLLAIALALWPAAARGRVSDPCADPASTRRRVPTAARTPLPRIQCPPGYAAVVYAEGLSGPDGLAFGPSGELYVAEETAGRVSRVAADGSATPVVSGLAAPEGIAFDDAGNLYVVEDVEGGRLIRVASDGSATILTTGLDAPEGVAWQADDDTLYVTESNAQFVSFPQDPLRTRVTAVSPRTGTATRVVTETLASYAGITVGPDGLLYVTNEASGWISTASVFTVDPEAGSHALFASDLLAPEGLRFDPEGFPLYVAEEDTGDGEGRLSRVEADGSHTPFCTGFRDIEDVTLDGEGHLYVSEDGSGLIVLIDAAWRVWLPLVRR